MRAELTKKQTKFVASYLETGNATEATDRAYKAKNRNTAHAIGAENLRKPTIKAYLEASAADAMAEVYRLSQRAKNEAVRLNASRDILDRAGYFVDKSKPQLQDKPQVTKIIVVAPEIAEQNGVKHGTVIGDMMIATRAEEIQKSD